VAGDHAPGCYLDKPPGCTPGPTGTCAQAPIGAVRITLIARGASPELSKPLAGRPGAEDRAAAATFDSYDRAVLTTLVVPRNLAR